MNKKEFRKHCEKQIEMCIKLHDEKHLREHELALGLLNENERLIQQKNKYKEVIDKAIEYINSYDDGCYTDSTCKYKVAELNITKLLDILKESD